MARIPYFHPSARGRITKYRHKVLRGAVAERVREVVREECAGSGWTSCKGHFGDHVHVLLSIPPQVTISRLIQQLKGKAPISCCGVATIGNATGATRVGAGYFAQQWQRHR